MTKLLEVKKINKSFPGQLFESSQILKGQFIEKAKQVLYNVSFDVIEGRTVGFVGGNGSGKTTSLKCILDFIKPDSGEVLFWGKPISINAKNKIGYLPERPYLYEFLTASSFLKFHWELAYGKGKPGFEEKMKEVLSKVKLSGVEGKRLRSFSKGMLQRIGIAQAIISDPKFLIFDEPMSGLDPDGRIMVKDIIRGLKEKKTTILFTSHLLQDVEELCEDLVVIQKGKIVYTGELKKFLIGTQNLEESFRGLIQGEGSGEVE